MQEKANTERKVGVPKISQVALSEVQKAVEDYQREVERSKLQPSTKRTYLTDATNFVRWLEDDFRPSALSGSRARVARRLVASAIRLAPA